MREIAIEKIIKIRFNRSTIKNLQEITKTFLYHIFKDINLYIIYIKRVTIIIKNI